MAAHRPAYAASLSRREPLGLVLDRHGRHRVVRIELPSNAAAPAAGALQSDATFEARIGAYLKSTQEWAPADKPPPAERHFIRKKRRARLFEARPNIT